MNIWSCISICSGFKALIAKPSLRLIPTFIGNYPVSSLLFSMTHSNQFGKNFRNPILISLKCSISQLTPLPTVSLLFCHKLILSGNLLVVCTPLCPYNFGEYLTLPALWFVGLQFTRAMLPLPLPVLAFVTYRALTYLFLPLSFRH